MSAAVKGVVAKPGYADLTVNRIELPATREQFEEDLMFYWDHIFTHTDYDTLQVVGYVAPTTEDLQRLYDATVDTNGDPMTIDVRVFRILADELFLESATDARWQPYVDRTIAAHSLSPHLAHLQKHLEVIEQAQQGKVFSESALRKHYEEQGLPGLAEKSLDPKPGTVIKIPAGDPIGDALIELYIGYFNRAPEQAGIDYWRADVERYMADGNSLQDAMYKVAESFWPASLEFSHINGIAHDMPTVEFVQKIYANVLGRPDAVENDQEGIAYWAAEMDNGVISRGQMIVSILHSARVWNEENADSPLADFVGAYLDNRVAVSRFFAQEEYSGRFSGEQAVLAGMDALAGIDDSHASVQAALASIKTMASDSAQTASSFMLSAFELDGLWEPSDPSEAVVPADDTEQEGSILIELTGVSAHGVEAVLG